MSDNRDKKLGGLVKKFLARQKGFLIVEVMLAVLIISIALVAAMGMFIYSTKANSDASEYTVAATLAQKQLEMLKMKDPQNYWAKLDLTSTTKIAWQDTTSPPPTRYTIDTVASACSENPNLVEVIVTVAWDKRNSQPANIKITTYYSKIPLQG